MTITGVCNEVTKLKNKDKFYVSKYDETAKDEVILSLPNVKTKAMKKQFFDTVVEEEEDTDTNSESEEDIEKVSLKSTSDDSD